MNDPPSTGHAYVLPGRVVASATALQLERDGAAVESCRVGRRFDVILMDMEMPVWDGYVATAKLRAEGYTGKIIALIVRSISDQRERSSAAGCDDYLSKPVSGEDLVAAIVAQVEAGEVKAAEVKAAEVQAAEAKAAGSRPRR